MRISALENTAETEVSHNPRIKKKVLISAGEIPYITNFSRAVFPAGEVAPGHSHRDMTEVFFVESGRGEICVNGNNVELRPGTCVTVEPTESHELRNTGTSDLVVLYFGVALQESQHE